MLRTVPGVIALAVSLLMAAAAAAAPAPTSPHKKRNPKHHVTRHWHGYGFLPGYRTPRQIEIERELNYPPVFWQHGYGIWADDPRFYRGRWNGGGFGPCYTQTPIGPVWNCGR